MCFSIQRKFAKTAGIKIEEKQNRAVKSLEMISTDVTTEATSE